MDFERLELIYCHEDPTSRNLFSHHVRRRCCASWRPERRVAGSLRCRSPWGRPRASTSGGGHGAACSGGAGRLAARRPAVLPVGVPGPRGRAGPSLSPAGGGAKCQPDLSLSLLSACLWSCLWRLLAVDQGGGAGPGVPVTRAAALSVRLPRSVAP